MSQEEVKRQHYVPRTYLKQFATERSGQFYINALPTADCSAGNIIELNISNVCLQKDLYTLSGETPEERMLLERFYSDFCETYYQEIYQLLVDPNKKTLSDAERDLIISTVVTMFYRTTKRISDHNEVLRRAYEQAYELCNQTGTDYFIFENQKISIAGKSLKQLQKDNEYNNRPEQVLIQLQVALDLITLRSARDRIKVLKLEDGSLELITSDNPVTYSNILARRRIIPFDPNNMLSLPLDRNHILQLLPFSTDTTKHSIWRHNFAVRISNVCKLNSDFAQFENSERFIIGTENGIKGFLNLKQKYDLD